MSITINVSGKIYKIPSNIIQRSQLFDNMMTDCVIDEEIIIDRSPKLFEHVRAYLLDPKYPYPKKYYSELDYYLIPYDIELLYDANAIILKDLKKIKEDIEKIENNISDIRENVVAIKDEIELSDETCAAYYCDSRCIRGTRYCNHHINYDNS